MIHLGGLDHCLHCFSNDVWMPGLVNWPKVFNGEVRHYEHVSKEEIESADIIYINLTGVDRELPRLVRKLIGWSTSTKVVASLDYSVEIMQRVPQSMTLYDLVEAMKNVDLFFAVEPGQWRFLTWLHKMVYDKTRFRKIPLIPHPVPTHVLKTYKSSNKVDFIAVHFHRYDRQTMVPAVILHDLPIHVMLVGYNLSLPTVPEGYDGILFYDTTWRRYINFVRYAKIGFEYVNMHVLGRFSLEMACLGIPVVGTKLSFGNLVCFREISHNPWSFNKLRESVEKLLSSDKFYQEVVDFASQRVEYFNYRNSRERLLKSLETLVKS